MNPVQVVAVSNLTSFQIVCCIDNINPNSFALLIFNVFGQTFPSRSAEGQLLHPRRNACGSCSGFGRYSTRRTSCNGRCDGGDITERESVRNRNRDLVGDNEVGKGERGTNYELSDLQGSQNLFGARRDPDRQGG